MPRQPQFPSIVKVLCLLLAWGAEPANAQADTLDAATYNGWKQYRLLCDRCHGEEARGTTFGPDLLPAFKPSGTVPSVEAFKALLATGRPDAGMPSAATLGLGAEQVDGIYAYLHGRSSGQFTGGRPVQRER